MPVRKKKDQEVKVEFDISRNINVAAKTGKIICGEQAIVKHLAQNTMKLIIFANNCAPLVKQRLHKFAKLNSSPVPLYTFPQSSVELGLAAGRPFMVAAMGIVEEGDSEVLKASPQV